MSFNFAFDDWLKLWVNDVLIGTYRHDSGFANIAIPVSLKKGKNKVLVKLSNFRNQDFLCWAFHLSVAFSVRV